MHESHTQSSCMYYNKNANLFQVYVFKLVLCSFVITIFQLYCLCSQSREVKVHYQNDVQMGYKLQI